MAGYIFHKKDNTGNANLEDVDNEICEIKGETPDPVEFSISYDVVVTIGIAVWAKFENVTPENLARYFREVEISDRSQALALEFLTNRYQFVAWR